MIRLEKVRELTLQTPPGPGRPAHLSAASGLVRCGERLYVVADDEHHLGVFPASGSAAGDLIQVFPGELPEGRKQRKAEKPDLEVLVRLPAFAACPDGALLALASGSRPNRRTGALISLDAHGMAKAPARPIDLASVYEALEHRLVDLNIEGAVVLGQELVLLQRGNKRNERSALIHLHLSEVLEALARTDSLGTRSPIGIRTLELGTIGGIPFAFSDAAALPDGRLIFTAIAEDTGSSYDDGPCAGAAIGIAESDGQLHFLEPIEPCSKIEGIEAQVEGSVIRLLLVTDADDKDTPACLLAGEIARYRPGN